MIYSDLIDRASNRRQHNVEAVVVPKEAACKESLRNDGIRRAIDLKPTACHSGLLKQGAVQAWRRTVDTS